MLVKKVDKVKSVDRVEEADPLIGQRLGNYLVQRLIGRGGMARVYEGCDEKLGRRAAIKVMETHPDRDILTTQRFTREARAIANLDHPNIPHVFEFGDHPYCYIAMKYIEGETLLRVLAEMRRRGKYLEPANVVHIVTELASALDYAHGQGILHRDIKPANIMIGLDNRVSLMDFGLAMQVGSPSTPGTSLGTPRYIAPEQAMSSQQSVPQSDIYSLGVVMYEMATGYTPFDDDVPMQLALSHITRLPPPPQSLRRDLPHAVQTVILKALEKRPADRWQTATLMADALHKAYKGIEPKVTLTLGNPGEPLAIPRAIPASGEEETMLLPVAKVPQLPARRSRKGRVTFTALLMTVLASVGVYNMLPYVLPHVLPQDARPAPMAVPPLPRVEARVRLIYNQDALVIYNATSEVVSLEGISFVRDDNSARPFLASQFGDRTHRALPVGQCLRIVKRSAVDRDRPMVCNGQVRPLIYDDLTVVFWATRGLGDITRSFRVERNGAVLQVCSMRLNTCEFALP
jgi:serine/threonine protein kinase